MAKDKNPTSPTTIEEALVVIEKLEKEKAEALDLAAELKKELASATKKAESKENIVEFNKAKYKVTAKKFHYNGTIHDADDLAENKELVKELVEIGAGFLVKIEE